MRLTRPATAALLAAAVTAALPAGVCAADVSAPPILQIFEASYRTIERRAPDIFLAGYGALWTPPPGRADMGNFSVGYDVYDRFDLGSAGNYTLYGSETGLKTAIAEMHKLSVDVYTDLVWNHAGFSDASTPGFVNAGGYPGLAITLPADVDGDFHGPFEGGDWHMRLSGLVDMAQEKNHPFVRNPVPGFANNIPTGSTPAFGRLANVPTEANRRFYPDQQGPSTTYFDPALNSSVTYYEWNSAHPSAGDPVSENATGYLMRHTRWMVEEIGVDGFRIDATKHFPQWVLNYYDQAVYKAIKTPLLDGSPKHVFAFGEFLDANIGLVQSTIRKDINDSQVSGNRDALDFALHYALINNLSGTEAQNNWHNIVNNTQDIGDDGLANNGSQGVAFDASHDEAGAHLGNVAHAYTLMRPGDAIVYFNAKEFGDGRDFPEDGRGDALGGVHGNTITTLVGIRNSHGRGNYAERWIDDHTLVFERSNSLIAGYNNRLHDGYDERTVQTSFEPGTKLVELTGNAADPAVDAAQPAAGVGGTLHDMVSVNGSGQITIRIPRNVTGLTEHGKGYVIYGPATPKGTLSFSNVARTIAGGTPTEAANGTTRLASVDVIKSDAFEVRLYTIPVVLPDGSSDPHADGDAAVLRLNGGIDLNGNGVVDVVAPGDVAYGFERFLTKSSPLFGGGDGQFRQFVDAATLDEGYHYVTARAFRHRDDDTGGDGGPAVFTDFRKVIYVDRFRADAALAEVKPIGSPSSDDRDVIIRSTDKTATSVHVFHNLGASQFSLEQLVQQAAAGQNSAGEYDRELFRYGLFDLKDGNHVLTVVTFEASYDPAMGYAGGGVNVQRMAGIGFGGAGFAGAGLGDINFDGVYSGADPNLFGNLLAGNNTSFNPAADLNADGLIGEADNVLNVPWLTSRGGDALTIRNATSLRLSRALALDGSLHIPAGELDVTGAMVPGVPLTFTSSFNIPAGRTIMKTGGEALIIDAPQMHGAGAVLHVGEGEANFNTDGGGNLSVVTAGPGAQARFNVTQHLKSVRISDGGAVSLAAGGGNTLVTTDLHIDGATLNLNDNRLVVDYPPGGPSAMAAVIDGLRDGRSDGNWNGARGIVSAAVALAGAGLFALGVAEASHGLDIDGTHTTQWIGQTVDASSVLVRFTYAGDATLDGTINIDDYGRIDSAVGAGVGGWFDGDFDYDGKINIDDYGIIDGNLIAQGEPLELTGTTAGGGITSGVLNAVSAVPEPSGAMAMLAVAGTVARVRRNRIVLQTAEDELRLAEGLSPFTSR